MRCLTLHSHRSGADYKNEILGPRNILRCCALRSVWRENKIIEVTKNLLLNIKIFKTIIKIIITIIIIMSQEKIIIILLGQSPGLKVIWSMANPPLLAFPSNTRRNVFLMSTATWGNRRVEQLSGISIIHVTQQKPNSHLAGLPLRPCCIQLRGAQLPQLGKIYNIKLWINLKKDSLMGCPCPRHHLCLRWYLAWRNHHSRRPSYPRPTHHKISYHIIVNDLIIIRKKISLTCKS